MGVLFAKTINFKFTQTIFSEINSVLSSINFKTVVLSKSVDVK